MRRFFMLAFAGFLAVTLMAAPVSYAGTTEAVSVDSKGKLRDAFSNEPAISADGRFVAFRSVDGSFVGGIFVHDRQTGAAEIVSKDSNGNPGNTYSDQSAISADGRFVAFRSRADNLVPGDTNRRADVFVHDRQTGTTEVVSKDSNGNLGNSHSSKPAISADGRFVAFASMATNLVPGDTNGMIDIFVHDSQTGKTEVVSKDSNGNLGNSHSSKPAISADGRFVAFHSTSNNLVQDDTNGITDIFVHDRQRGKTEVVSKDSKGNLGNSHSNQAAISANGRFVAFVSRADNLVSDDTNGMEDIFVHDRQTGKTKIVSKDSNGTFGNNHSNAPAISADGRYVAFESMADNLVPDDTNEKFDAFIHDRQTGKTEIVTVDSAGNQQNNVGRCINPSVSEDGRYVAFESEANNLVPDDTNGESDVFVRDRQ